MGTYDNCASLSGSLSLQVTENVDPSTIDASKLSNLPTINGVVLKGDLTAADLGIERGYDAHVDPGDDEHVILST